MYAIFVGFNVEIPRNGETPCSTLRRVCPAHAARPVRFVGRCLFTNITEQSNLAKTPTVRPNRTWRDIVGFGQRRGGIYRRRNITSRQILYSSAARTCFGNDAIVRDVVSGATGEHRCPFRRSRRTYGVFTYRIRPFVRNRYATNEQYIPSGRRSRPPAGLYAFRSGPIFEIRTIRWQFPNTMARVRIHRVT